MNNFKDSRGFKTFVDKKEVVLKNSVIGSAEHKFLRLQVRRCQKKELNCKPDKFVNEFLEDKKFALA
jgi:hypothetical protein